MSLNQNNIWNKIELEFPKKNFIKKKFVKKIIKIKQIDKLNNNPMFIKKKRGRKLKLSNEPRRYGIHDKFSNDNLKRKVKTHFHNYIIAILNCKIAFKSDDRLMRFAKIKSSITQNITVEYNLNLFNTKIKDIVKEVSDKYQNKDNNFKCLEYIMENQNINQEVIKYLNMTYKDLYLNYYLKSTKESFIGTEMDESYERHKEKLKEKFGELYLKNYIRNAEDLINFYNTCKKRKPKKKKNGNNSYINPSEELQKLKKEYINNEEIKLNNQLDLVEEFFKKNNRVSTGTQTDTKKIDDESENEYSLYFFNWDNKEI